MPDDYDDEFYDKMEGERAKSRREPLRLAHLLLAKASLDDNQLEFPSTIDEFLQNDSSTFGLLGFSIDVVLPNWVLNG
ncbi:hypothetical protein OSB04_008802 [Centaurea solstitialis]|uniref:Uncharacterized protein n=1 Tax=Centaurea solstitialis TaxID=347529 RepID=A0AA38WJT7_9ASTR|nr:hypothetical protein OSB04_008802 [Centaurea solstitialis]